MYMLTCMSTHKHMLTREYIRTHTHTHAHIAPRPGGDGLNSYLGLTWPGCTDTPPPPLLCVDLFHGLWKANLRAPAEPSLLPGESAVPPLDPHSPGPAPSSPAAGVCLGPLLPCSLGRQGAPEGWDPACFAPVSSAASWNAGWGWGVVGSVGEGDGGCELAE